MPLLTVWPVAMCSVLWPRTLTYFTHTHILDTRWRRQGAIWARRKKNLSHFLVRRSHGNAWAISKKKNKINYHTEKSETICTGPVKRFRLFNGRIFYLCNPFTRNRVNSVADYLAWQAFEREVKGILGGREREGREGGTEGGREGGKLPPFSLVRGQSHPNSFSLASYRLTVCRSKTCMVLRESRVNERRPYASSCPFESLSSAVKTGSK